ncbi:unnamed protein product, partial [Brachionus calyciflorus]
TEQAGGSEYYIKSVYKVKRPLIKNYTEKLYLEHVGCFELGNQSEYIQFKDMSISKCMIHCTYTNSNVLASMGQICFCLNSTQHDKKLVKNLFCGDISRKEGYFIGVNNQNLTDHYIIKNLNESFVMNNTFYAEYISGLCKTLIHTVIALSLKDTFECKTFCYNHNYTYAEFRINYCYCGKNLGGEATSNCWNVYKLSAISTTIQNTVQTSLETTQSTQQTTNYEKPNSNSLNGFFNITTENFASSTISNMLNLTTDFFKTTPVLNKPILTTEQFSTSKILINEDLTTEVFKTKVDSDQSEFQSLSELEIVKVLEKIDYDLTGCLVNCSNHGSCKLIKNKFYKKQLQAYKGSYIYFVYTRNKHHNLDPT